MSVNCIPIKRDPPIVRGLLFACPDTVTLALRTDRTLETFTACPLLEAITVTGYFPVGENQEQHKLMYW
jgi:hypothetical protein